MTLPTPKFVRRMSRKVVKKDKGAPPAGPTPGRRSPASAWVRLPLVAKVLIPIFAMTLSIGLAAAVFFSGEQVTADRVTQAGQGKTIAVVIQGALVAMADEPSNVAAFLRHVHEANPRVGAICVLIANPNDPLGPLLVYASSGPALACEGSSTLVPGLGGQQVFSEFAKTSAGSVMETEVATSLSSYGRGVIIEVQVLVTPLAEVAIPMFEKVAGTALLLAVFQTALVFGVLWVSALRPLKSLRLKASAATRSARPSHDIAATDRSGDEIHDLSLRFEEMLGAVRDREAELVESHDRLEALITNSPVIVFSLDSEGVILQIQGNAVAALARDFGERTVIGTNLLELVHRNSTFTDLLLRALAGEKVHDVVGVRNWMSATASPDLAYLDVLMTPALDSDGRLVGITGLAVDVTDRIDAASARAESQQKSAFLAAMSHELRTPLNSIMGFSQLLQMPASKAALTGKQRRYVGHIYSSGEHLLALVSDILDLAKVGAGQMEVNREPVALYDEVKDPVDKMRPLAVEKGLTIEIDIPADLTSFTDRLRVRQILLNLLTNAVKFTPQDGGPILVTGRTSGDGVEIAVSDSGIGIAIEEQVRIFEEFTQVDRGPNRRLDGTGLGLALTKKMVAIVGGSIRVDSRLGRGSTFTVWLPDVLPSAGSGQLAAAQAS